MGYSNLYPNIFNGNLSLYSATGLLYSLYQDPTTLTTQVYYNFQTDTGSKFIPSFSLFFVDTSFGFSDAGLAVGVGPVIAIDPAGNIGDGTSIGNFSVLKVNGSQRIDANGYSYQKGATPATSAAAGTVGQMSWDANFLYVCTATNTWKRITLVAF